MFLVYVVLCLIVFGCQYQCNWLPGKTRLWNDVLCVEWDVKPYTLTHCVVINATADELSDWLIDWLKILHIAVWSSLTDWWIDWQELLVELVLHTWLHCLRSLYMTAYYRSDSRHWNCNWNCNWYYFTHFTKCCQYLHVSVDCSRVLENTFGSWKVLEKSCSLFSARQWEPWAVCAWNVLSSSIQLASSLAAFRRLLKKHRFKRSFRCSSCFSICCLCSVCVGLVCGLSARINV